VKNKKPKKKDGVERKGNERQMLFNFFFNLLFLKIYQIMNLGWKEEAREDEAWIARPDRQKKNKQVDVEERNPRKK